MKKVQIDFYILKVESFEKSYPFCCQLIEKIYSQENAILVETQSSVVAQKFSDMLWDFKPSSFLPHQVFESQIKIATLSEINNTPSVKLNLYMPDEKQAVAWERLLQIVPNEPNLLQLARQNYRYYQQENYILNSHQIK
jgi:DNA polymerase III subunit chi